MNQYYKRRMRARVRADNQDAQEDQALLDEFDAREADNEVADRIGALGPVDDQGGVATAKVEEEEVGAGRRRRGRTKHRTKRRTVKPAHIKHLYAG